VEKCGRRESARWSANNLKKKKKKGKNGIEKIFWNGKKNPNFSIEMEP
jgi:hypothetical protein